MQFFESTKTDTEEVGLSFTVVVVYFFLYFYSKQFVRVFEKPFFAKKCMAQ